MSLLDDSDELHGVENMFDWDHDGKLDDFERFMMEEEVMGNEWEDKSRHPKTTAKKKPVEKKPLSKGEKTFWVIFGIVLLLAYIIEELY